MLRTKLAIFALAAIGAVFTGCDVQSETITHDATGAAAPLTRIVTNLDIGDVVVNPGTSGTAHVEAEAQWSATRPTVTFRQEGSTLYIDAACEERDTSCRVDITLTAPPGVAIEVSGVETTITATGQRGAATLRTGQGDVLVEDMSGALTLASREGEIRGNALRTAIARADTLDGAVNLVFAAGADDVSITTVAGDVLLTVPRVPYRVDAETEGKLSIGVTQSSTSTTTKKLYVHSGTGDITIRPR